MQRITVTIPDMTEATSVAQMPTQPSAKPLASNSMLEIPSNVTIIPTATKTKVIVRSKLLMVIYSSSLCIDFFVLV